MQRDKMSAGVQNCDGEWFEIEPTSLLEGGRNGDVRLLKRQAWKTAHSKPRIWLAQ